MSLLVMAHPGCPGHRAVKWQCVCVCVCVHACVRACVRACVVMLSPGFDFVFLRDWLGRATLK